jgi:CSLREA domain-containing protein
MPSRQIVPTTVYTKAFVWISLCMVMALLCEGFVASASAQTGQPRLVLSGPSVAVVNQPVIISLSLFNAQNLAGYQAAFNYDTQAAEFAATEQLGSDLRSQLRDVLPIKALGADGITLGAFSCPVANCLESPFAPRGSRTVPGTNGDLLLASFSLLPQKAGQLEINLADILLVDPLGKSLAADLAISTITIDVGTSNDGFSAPRTQARHSVLPIGATANLDLNGDSRVDYADAAVFALEWVQAYERGVVCGDPYHSLGELNGDGCIDVSDALLLTQAFGSMQPAARLSGGDVTFVVNSTGDAGDANVSDGVCQTAAGVCTLRAAIDQANANTGPNNITFAIAGTGVKTIQLTNSLPALSDMSGGTFINGYTQTGASANTDPLASNAQIRIEVLGCLTTVCNMLPNGSYPAAEDIFQIISANNEIRGLSLYNGRRKFFMYGKGAQYNVIAGNFIGTNSTGSYQQSYLSNSAGINLAEGTSYNRVGGSNPADRNVISGNSHNAMTFFDEGTDHNHILNNIIGLRPNGTQRRRNASHGIDINSHAAYNIIEGNVVSGNSQGEAIEISHATLTTGNQVINNLIGTDVTGEAATSETSNAYNGIHLEDRVTNNIIANNVIGNNGNNSGSNFWRKGGITIEGYFTNGNEVRDNWIGVTRGGLPIPNENFGIRIIDAAQYNVIGPNNKIANNRSGIIVSNLLSNELVDNNSFTDYNTITRNSIYDNSYIGIDIDSEGPTPNDLNDADTGANEGLNAPVLSQANTQAVQGTACSVCTIEVFVSSTSGTAIAQGKTFIGAGSSLADGSFIIPVSGVSLGQYVTATATDVRGNTSEFAAQIVVSSGSIPMPTATTVVSAPQSYAYDRFGRTLGYGWGRADKGGEYVAYNGTGYVNHDTFDYLSTNGAGTLTLTRTNTTIGSYMTDVWANDVDVLTRLRVDRSTGTLNTHTMLVARHVNGNSEYRGRVTVSSIGRISLRASRIVQNSETVLSSEVSLPVTTINYTHNTFMWVRMQAMGNNPTTIRMRVWPDGQPEPATWHYSVNDSTALLQASGNIGFRSYVSDNSKYLLAQPVNVSFDDLCVTNGSVGAACPPETALPTVTQTATQTASATATQTASATATETATLTQTATETATQTASVTATETATLTQTATETPTLTQTATETASATATETATLTQTASETPTLTQTASQTASATASQTATTSVPTSATTVVPTTATATTSVPTSATTVVPTTATATTSVPTSATTVVPTTATATTSVPTSATTVVPTTVTATTQTNVPSTATTVMPTSATVIPVTSTSTTQTTVPSTATQSRTVTTQPSQQTEQPTRDISTPPYKVYLPIVKR